MYEHHHEKLLPNGRFVRRVAGHVAFAVLAVGVALGIGVLGYHVLGKMRWTDALLNASMILGGMGPVDALSTDAAKVFASMYALFSGLVFIALLGLLLAPFIHRLMHHLHIADEDEEK